MATLTEQIAIAKALRQEHGGMYLATREWGADTIEITATDDVSQLGYSCQWVATRSERELRRCLRQTDPYLPCALVVNGNMVS